MSLLIVDADLGGRTCSVRVAGRRVVALGPSLQPEPSDEHVIDADGGALIPGLHDHHVHLTALAAAATPCGPPEVTSRETLRRALRDSGPGDVNGWIRGTGYHESVAGLLDVAAIDTLVADRPVRIQHRSGKLWMVNSLAASRLGLDGCQHVGVERDAAGRPTGRLWRMDAWIRERTPSVDLSPASVGRRAAARGVTGFTDADPARDADGLALLDAWTRTGLLPQRVHAMTPGDLDAPGDNPRLTLGPRKILLDDESLPSLDELIALLRRAPTAGVAIHCVSRLQLVLALTALDEVEHVPARIEHGSVVPMELIDQLRRRNVTVVTQPNFVHERGDDYLKTTAPHDLPHLYRLGSLQRAGVAVVAGTDTPHGADDPWVAVTAAVTRQTRTGAVLGAGERVSPQTAIDLFAGTGAAPTRPRRVSVGSAADLCLLSEPLDPAVWVERPPAVRTTIIGGEVVHDLELVR